MDVNLQDDISRRVALLLEVRDLLGEPGPELAPSNAAASIAAPPAAAAPPAPMPPEVKARIAGLEGAVERLREQIDALRRQPQETAEPASALAGKALERSEAIAGLLESVIASFSANHEELRLQTERMRKRLMLAVVTSLLLGVAGIVLAVIATGWLHPGPLGAPAFLDGVRHAFAGVRAAILPKP